MLRFAPTGRSGFYRHTRMPVSPPRTGWSRAPCISFFEPIFGVSARAVTFPVTNGPKQTKYSHVVNWRQCGLRIEPSWQ